MKAIASDWRSLPGKLPRSGLCSHRLEISAAFDLLAAVVNHRQSFTFFVFVFLVDLVAGAGSSFGGKFKKKSSSSICSGSRRSSANPKPPGGVSHAGCQA
jgi:hypothetical protein